jgi:phosphohistidine phosphatase
MARQIYLIRHAETADKQWGETDLERKLTTKGVEDAQKLRALMVAQPFPPQAIMHSHAVRTTHTAQILAGANTTILLLTEPLIYHASPSDLLHIIHQWNDAWTSVALVGHNPTISALANEMSEQRVGNFSPAAVAGFAFETNRWADIIAGQGVVTLFKEPNIL